MQYLTRRGHLSVPFKYYEVMCENAKTEKDFNLQLEDYLSFEEKERYHYPLSIMNFFFLHFQHWPVSEFLFCEKKNDLLNCAGASPVASFISPCNKLGF